MSGVLKRIPLWILILTSFASFRVRSAGALWDDGGIDAQVKFQIAVWILLGLLAVSYIFRGRGDFNSLKRGPLFFYCCFILLAFLSASYSPQPYLTLFRSGQLAIAVLLLVSLNLQAEDFFLFIITFVILNLMFMGLGILLQGGPQTWYPSPMNNFMYYDAAPGSPFRLATAYGHPFTIGVVAAAGAAGILARIVKGNAGLYHWMGFIMLAGATLLTVTRTAIAGMFLGILVVLALKRKILPLLIIGAAFSLLFLSESFRAELSNYIYRGQTVLQLKAMTGRDLIFNEVLQRATESPLIGEGFSAARKEMLLARQFGIKITHAHNLLLEAFLALGAIGTMAIVITLLALIRSLIQSLRYLDNAHSHGLEVTAAAIPLLVSCFTGVGYAGSISAVVIIFIMVMVLAQKGSMGLG